MSRIAKCFVCGCVASSYNSLHPFKHTTGTRYICTHCSPTAGHDVGGYSTENGVFVGKETENGFTISKEFEVPRSAAMTFGHAGVAYLKSKGFIQTDDCTVWYEFKSPIFNNKNSWARISREIEARFGTEWTHDSTYGTHTNVGHPDLDVSLMERWYESLFTRLYKTVNETSAEKVRNVFGRTSCYWAEASLTPEYGAHTRMWNTEHTTHLELRLNKWTSYAQDKLATAYAVETVGACVEFCNAIRMNRSSLQGDMLVKANRIAAEKAGRKIDNIFRKYVGLERVNKTEGYTSRR